MKTYGKARDRRGVGDAAYFVWDGTPGALARARVIAGHKDLQVQVSNGDTLMLIKGSRIVHFVIIGQYVTYTKIGDRPSVRVWDEGKFLETFHPYEMADQ